MNILMVSNGFPPSIGGVQTHVAELSRALVQLGHHVHVITRIEDRSSATEEDFFGVHVHRIKLPSSHLLYDWIMRRTVRALHRSISFDVIHVHGMRPLKACSDNGPPLVFTNHTSSFVRRSHQGGRVKEKMRKQLALADLIFTPSSLLAEKTREAGFGGTIEYICNGVDIERYSPGPSSMRSTYGIPDQAFVAIFAGRLQPVKGLLVLARALQQLHEPDLFVVVAGDGSERQPFEEARASFAFPDNVIMLGAVPNEKMVDLYRGSDVLLLPSLMEATSISGLEAMACGLPIIGSRVGGIPAIVDEEQSGLLVQPGNEEALALAIKTLKTDRKLCAELGQNSRTKVVTDFSWETIAAQIVKAYKQCLSSRD
ncbi:MAG: hypothetical protein CME36_04300 [unclassified Hahellaceae]|nr:hypothetical protein [Hahellaceae bacterium]